MPDDLDAVLEDRKERIAQAVEKKRLALSKKRKAAAAAGKTVVGGRGASEFASIFCMINVALTFLEVFLPRGLDGTKSTDVRVEHSPAVHDVQRRRDRHRLGVPWAGRR